MAASETRLPRIALRPDSAGNLGDVVVTEVEMFRMEDMGDYWWLCCYLTNGEQVTWSAVREEKRVRMVTVEEPTPGTFVDFDAEKPASPSPDTTPDQSRVTEDDLRDHANRVIAFGGSGMPPREAAAQTLRVLDALETALADAREKDETIARLRGALECACDHAEELEDTSVNIRDAGLSSPEEREALHDDLTRIATDLYTRRAALSSEQGDDRG